MILTVVDHASNVVPEGIDLGVDPALMTTHIAWDIGVENLARELGYPSHIATVSRLVIDCNRAEDAPGLIPLESDGVVIPGNPGDTTARMALYHAYHDALASRFASERPVLLLSLHSFTPRLKSGEPRPWDVGVLYNNDDRAARIAIPLLEAAGVVTGDQQPYCGKILNATMNRHGEGTGTPYLGLEVRQNLIDTPQGIVKWATILRPVIDACAHAVQANRR